jgi:hypothetical protein
MMLETSSPVVNFESMLQEEGQHSDEGNRHLFPFVGLVEAEAEQQKLEESRPESPRSITVAYKGKSLTPRGSPQGSRNSSFNWEASLASSSNGNGNDHHDLRPHQRVSRRELDFTLEHFVNHTEVTHTQQTSSKKKAAAGAKKSGTKKKSSASSSASKKASAKEKETRVTGVRGVHQMGSRYGKRFQVRVWLKAGQFQRSMSEEEKKKRKSGGKRIHLGCFGNIETATRAFDIVEIFFMGWDKAKTNVNTGWYSNSPVLHFLFNTVKDRTCLEDFMTVWKHIMPFRWVLDYPEANADVQEKLAMIKDKLDKFRNRKHHSSQSLKECQHQHQMHRQQQPNNLSQFFQMLVKEKSANAANASAQGQAQAATVSGPGGMGGMLPCHPPSHPTHHASLLSGQQGKQLSDLNVIDATPLAFSNSSGGYPMQATMPHDYDSTLYNQVHTAMAQGMNDNPFYYY